MSASPTTLPRKRTHRSELVALTAAKTVSNTALRWIGPFLPTLERAFSTTTGTLTGIIGVCELGGLSTVVTGPHLDRGRERRVFALGLSAVAVSSVIALIGTVVSFAIAFAVLILGVTNLTVAGHAWIGHRVAFSARGRAIGVYETSWAIALLVGAPIIAILIDWFGWRGPFVALAVAGALAALAVQLYIDDDADLRRSPVEMGSSRMPSTAWFPMIASAATAAAGLGIFVVSGTWLDEDHAVSTGGLGLVAAGFGAIELLSSTTVATAGDRIGSRRSVLVGLLILLVGCAVMATSGDSLLLAVTGIVTFLAGFEFAFVSSLTLVTEAAPRARGRAIGISNAIGTSARAAAIVASGQLYEAFGIAGSLTMVATFGACAIGFTLATPAPPTT